MENQSPKVQKDNIQAQKLVQQIQNIMSKCEQMKDFCIKDSQENSLNIFQISAFINDHFDTHLKRLSKIKHQFSSLSLKIKSQQPEYANFQEQKAQTIKLIERFQILRGKLQKIHQKVSDIFEEKSIQIARFINNEIEDLGPQFRSLQQIKKQPSQQGAGMIPVKPILRFTLTENQLKFLQQFIYKFKQDIVLAGAPKNLKIRIKKEALLVRIFDSPQKSQFDSEDDSDLENQEQNLQMQEDQDEDDDQLDNIRQFMAQTKKQQSSQQSQPALVKTKSHKIRQVTAKQFEHKCKIENIIIKALNSINTQLFHYNDWQMQVLQLRGQDGETSMLDNIANKKYLPVVISIHQNSISVTSIQKTYIYHFKKIIHEYLHTNPAMIKIFIEDQNLIAVNTMYKNGILQEIGLMNQCVIRFTNQVEGNNFCILIYHSKNQKLKQLAEEAEFQIMSRCEKSSLVSVKIPINDQLEYAFIQGNFQNFKNEIGMMFEGVDIVLGANQLVVKANKDEIQTLKLLLPDQIKVMKSALPQVEASRGFRIVQAAFPQITQMLLQTHHVTMIELDKQQELKDQEQKKNQQDEGINFTRNVYLQGNHQNINIVQMNSRKLQKQKRSKRKVQAMAISDDVLLDLIGIIQTRFHCQFYRNQQNDKQFFIEGLLVDRAEMHIQKFFHQKQIGENQIAFPQIWNAMENQGKQKKLLCFRFKLQPNSQEYQEIENNFMRTMNGYQIVEIQRIQNPILWRKYAIERQFLANKSHGFPNERHMFHGTRQNNPAMIYNSRIGFDFRFCNSGSWGFGSYFARDASYSNNYAFHQPDGTLTMFSTLVLQGEGYKCSGNGSLKMPPLKHSNASQRFDSVTSMDQSILIVYEHAKAYPAYLIHYTHGNNRGGMPPPIQAAMPHHYKNPLMASGWGRKKLKGGRGEGLGIKRKIRQMK